MDTETRTDIVRRVLADYLEVVRGNTSDDYNATAAVAYDEPGGESDWEIVEAAERLGYREDDYLSRDLRAALQRWRSIMRLVLDPTDDPYYGNH